MPSFDQLMAMSQTDTQRSQLALQSALSAKAARQATEAKARAEREAKEREMERKLRLKRMEEDQRAREREARLAAEREAREKELARREAEERERLLGQKRARASGSRPDYPSSSAGSKRRGSDDEGSGATALTREEKRERRLQAELWRSAGGSKRGSGLAGYGKSGQRLAGGAINKVIDNQTAFNASATAAAVGEEHLSARARLSRVENGLVKLNQNKRDTRSIDEIVRDLDKAKGRVLEGEAASKFAFFSDSKKEKAERDRLERAKQAASTATSSASGSPAPSVPRPSAPASSKTAPVSPAKSSAPALARKASAMASSSKPLASSSRPQLSTSKSSATLSFTKNKAAAVSSRPTSSSKPAPRRSLSPKRARRRSTPPLSDDLDSDGDLFEDRPAPKRSRLDREHDRGGLAGLNIWEIMNPGKSKAAYLSRDVNSDDEDMEVGIDEVEREEARSRKIARQEEAEAEEQERRHAEEKRRRKKEREASERAALRG